MRRALSLILSQPVRRKVLQKLVKTPIRQRSRPKPTSSGFANQRLSRSEIPEQASSLWDALRGALENPSDTRSALSSQPCYQQRLIGIARSLCQIGSAMDAVTLGGSAFVGTIKSFQKTQWLTRGGSFSSSQGQFFSTRARISSSITSMSVLSMKRLICRALRPRDCRSGASILLRFFYLAAGGNACLKGRLEAYRLVVLLQEVSKGRAGYLLKALTSQACDFLNRVPRLLIELDALAGHQSAASWNCWPPSPLDFNDPRKVPQ
jgi:hypothetical protein